MNPTISIFNKYKRAAALACLAILAACNPGPKPEENPIELGDAIFGIASPITLEGDTTTCYLSDYFLDLEGLDSIWLEGSGVSIVSRSQDALHLIGRSERGMSVLNVQYGSVRYAIPVKNAATVRYAYQTEPLEAEEVTLVGDFNNWNPEATSLQKSGDRWKTTLELYPGNYAYQVVVDGEWMLDPQSSEKRSNGMGGFNSILNIPFEEGELGLHNTLVSSGQGKVQIKTSQGAQHYVAFVDNTLIAEGEHTTGLLSLELPMLTEGRHFLRVWTAREGKLSNEIRVPLDGSDPVTRYDQLTRSDKERNMLYFMMVDRFVNGDTSIDDPVEDERVAPRANYLGGDIAGITQKLDEGYFRDLGVNTVWISPITQNPLGAYQEYPAPRRYYSGYHGYWPIRYAKVDHRLGSEADVKALIEQAHGQDMNVILDFVSNHVHEEHPMIKENPSFKTQLDLEDGTKNIRIWDAQRLTTWFDEFLPSLDFSQDEVVERVSDSALHWMTAYDFDGFRHDATKHIPTSFWRATTAKLKQRSLETGKPYFQVGETFGDRTLIQSYIGSGMMDGQFDFNVYFDARAVFQDTTTSMEVLASSLRSSLNIHGAQHLMCNITGNHDLPRFISYASGAIGYDEDEKAVGWERDIQVKDPVGYDRLKMLQTFITTIPGIPVIYYGDEIGMAGANDPDNRRMMRFDDLSPREQDVKENVQQLLQLRKDHLALIYGDLEVLSADKQSMLYKRQYLNDEVYVCFNNSSDSIQIDLPIDASQQSTWTNSNSSATLRLNEARSTIDLPPYQSTLIFRP